MTKVLIVDDETRARQVIRNYLRRFAPNLEILGEADSVASATAMLEAERPDLVFLDVRLQDGTGFDLLALLEEIDFQVIFVTAYDEYAIRAFRFNAIDYLLKPISPSEFREAIARAQTLRQPRPSLRHFAQTQTAPRRLTLKTLDSIHVVAVADIVRLQADNSYTTVYLRDGRSILVSRSLKYFADLLSEAHFARSHQSHLVNLYFVDRFDRPNMMLHLSDGIGVPVATRRRDQVLRLLERMVG
ncbi:MAG: LytTR family DNA-binding domain-containing protein [Bacteroidota bacterium]